MKKISNNIFFIMLISGTLITISSNSWLGAWMGLEINLLSFIPLMNEGKKNLMTSESSLKYFLTQAFASSILLFAIILMMMFFNENWMMNNNFNNLLILSTLLLKSGAAPFHFWFPGVMEGLNWINGLILMTWQKIAPLMLISYNLNINFFYFTILLSMIIGALGGLNQTSLRKLMAFSSINHIGWMLMAMMNNELLWLTYFLLYSILSMSIILMFNNFKLFHFNQIFNFSMMNPYIKFFMFLNLLSLGGLPPFLGFLPKWLVIQNLVEMNQLFLLFIAVCLTLITLYYYLRMSYSIYMLNYNKNSWMLMNSYSNNNLTLILTMNFISIMGLLIITLIYLIL
ncbi:NADH dehydrogenase subunit 2 (mitochondrion) [Aedes aegypti]|uniref:NADH-ubiquinone oxidoreductase chain 2 n=3 Tax=Aedes aegypti TaxID=7159 RepID=NU2M_AEDAE|nr:NADH dehydrogenase subunit 2 [Aedes aegypti]B0FWC6.1 RecName: Full=NADH-ubiquinone oxidoreductase chain 2; AltName: Full=NADH dehydrogenase subunit 2 [Aedes aegypti]ABY51623.1 NADH dehydrogenase subunit 2 [Aedes aegypti]ARW59264.1 NADH dehydrogenase subunit 2 [Aedes aegypti]AYO45906.1 NADH dehydrogenase subunit 2 [Aedes aegypti]AYO45916.1 NADH dehydrogenase subunit 2 [Aedes aegypti]QEE94216.1 NADH dehydrogenase subunit 2 [Aedes aegypti]